MVYVSPLRALAVDIAENLERPLAEIAAVAAELGLLAPRHPGGGADRGHDDRPAAADGAPAAQLRRHHARVAVPAGHQRAAARGRSRTVETVIVDEIHAVARDKRGAHLALTLERLEALCDQRPVRIGLSATQRPIETVGRLLVGDRPLPAVVDVGHQRHVDLALELPDGELEAVASAEQMADVLDRIAALVGRAPHHPGVRQHPAAGRAARPPARRAARRRRGGRPPRQPVQGPALPGRVAAAGRRPAGAGGHRLARAGHRHRPGRAGLPDRLAPQHRHLPAAGRPLQPQPGGHAQGPALPADPRRAGGVRRPAGRGAGRPARRDPPGPPAPRHPGPADRGRGGRQGVADDRAVRPGAPGGALPRPDPGPVRRGRRPGERRHRDRPGPAGRLPPPRRGQRRAAPPAAAPGWPRPPPAAPSPRPATTGSSPIPTTPSSARSTRTGPSSRWRATSSCSARHSWQIRRVEPGVVRVRDAGDTPPTVPVLAGRGAGPHGRAVRGGLRAAPPGRRAPGRRRPRRRPAAG